MDFFKRRHIKNQAVMEDASLGHKTLTHMLEGKDISMNCYLRLLTAMKGIVRMMMSIWILSWDF